MIVSARGTILNDAPRKYMNALIYVHFPMFAVELAVTCFATYTIFESKGLRLSTDMNLFSSSLFTLFLHLLTHNSADHRMAAERCFSHRSAAGARRGYLLCKRLYSIKIFDPLGASHVCAHDMAREQAKHVWRCRLRLLFLCANADDNAKNAFDG